MYKRKYKCANCGKMRECDDSVFQTPEDQGGSSDIDYFCNSRCKECQINKR